MIRSIPNSSGKSCMRKRPAGDETSRIYKRPCAEQSVPNRGKPNAHVARADVQAGAVPHYYDVALHEMDVSDIRVAIPSYDRPDMLSEATLTLLKRHGFPLQ